MIIDNKSNFLYEVFENKDIQELQILTPFITLYGFESIQKSLNTKTKFLLSDRVEKILGTNEELKYKNQLKQTFLVRKFAQLIQKIEVKSTLYLSILNIIKENFIIFIQELLEKLDFNKAPKTNLFMFYKYYIDLVVSFELLKYSINKADENILEKIKEIENKINSLKKKLKRESNLNEKVEINMKIYKLKEELNNMLKERK